jgi:D-amino-acid dehydrogenase
MNQESATRRHVTVVGAGIVGVSSALRLLHDGHKVTVVDRGAPGEGCSQGNAGLFASYSFVPLSMPGVLAQIPKWILDPLGPLAIRWRHAPWMLPWLVRFVRAGRPERVAEICDALAPLLASSLEEHQSLARGTAAEGLICSQGYMYVYEDAASLAKDSLAWRLRSERGSDVRPLTAGDIRDREPALAPIYRHGYFLPGLGYTVDPMNLVKGLARQVERSGGVVLRRQVRDIDIGPDGPRRLIADEGDLDLDVLVIAAGAWSGRLAARLGSPVPLEGERGYHVILPNRGITLKTAVFAASSKFVATPVESGIKFAGTSEFSGLDAPPNGARARILVAHARRMFPGIDTAGIAEWSGLRPTLPDSLPVIGPSPVFENVYFAFGHQHIGLTGGPRTGRLIADLVAGRTPNIDIRPFRADRF